jgi:1D-myo-inositol 3-kinase
MNDDTQPPDAQDAALLSDEQDAGLPSALATLSWAQHGPPDVLLIGHITADVLPNEGPAVRVLGGTVSYAARTYWAFGLRVGILTSAAADEPLLDELLPYAQIINVLATHTTTFENRYGPAGRTQYLLQRAGALGAAQLPHAWRSVSGIVQLAPLADEVDAQMIGAFATRPALCFATLQGWLRQWDSNGRVQFRAWADAAALAALDFAIFSEEDVSAQPQIAERWRPHLRHMVQTQGERGGEVYHADSITRYSTPPVAVVSPTGAGDVFAAALAAALWRGLAWPRALVLAARLAATCVTRPGILGTPTTHEVQAALATV